MRLKDKIAIIVGAGQGPGESGAVGNRRAIALLFAREGAKVSCADHHLDSAEETVRLRRRPLRPMQLHSPIIRNLVDRIADIYTPAPIRYSSS